MVQQGDHRITDTQTGLPLLPYTDIRSNDNARVSDLPQVDGVENSPNNLDLDRWPWSTNFDLDHCDLWPWSSQPLTLTLATLTLESRLKIEFLTLTYTLIFYLYDLAIDSCDLDLDTRLKTRFFYIFWSWPLTFEPVWDMMVLNECAQF